MIECHNCVHQKVCKYPEVDDDYGCFEFMKERPTCETCNYWNRDLKYCYHWSAFMGAEDYCSEHVEKEGEAE